MTTTQQPAPTPETDAAKFPARTGNPWADDVVFASFASQLERERDEARQINIHHIQENDALRAERDQWREKFHAMRKACRQANRGAYVNSLVAKNLTDSWRKHYDIAEGLRAELAALKASTQHTPLQRPDKPGWWWKWSNDATPPRWLPINVIWPHKDGTGLWLPATPPPAPKE